ncbi:MAG TPA: TonB-dependent receptor [Longimicrobiaceae bacterium]|nr:TonB-dependent receptor [Longimicrobiaceae bacterium]
MARPARRARRGRWLGCALGLAGASSLSAQGSDTARAVPIDTLAVRVLRLPVAPLRAPFAVSVTGGDAERRARPGLALDQALAAIPGVQVDNRFNYAVGERISVRGFGARAQFGVRGVRVLLDGLPATLPDGQTTLNHVDVGSLARVEVVRGPVAALYGNAAGGAIRLSTPPPPPAGGPAGEYRATAGANGLLRLGAAAGGATGGVGYRASVTRLEYGGFRALQSARSTLGGVTLALHRRRDDVRLSFTGVRYDARNPGGLTAELLAADRTQAAPPNLADRTGEEGSQGQLGATWERRTAGGSLEAAAWVLARSIDNPIPRRLIDLRRRAGGARAALSGAPAGAALRWSAGAELEVQRDDRRNYALEQGARGALTLDQLERVAAASAFAQGSASLGRLEVLAAVRYDRFRFSARDRLVATDNPDDSGGRGMGAWSPSAGVSWSAAPGLAFYANASTAFETPTTTELANRPTGAGGFNPELEPQRTTSYEAGARGRRGAAWAELAVYRARVRNALIPFEVAGSPGRQFFRNAGRAVHRGVEAAAGARPLPGATLRVAYAWTDARFGRYLVNDSTDLAGNRVPGIAPHRAEATLYWASPRGPFAGVDARHLAAVPVADGDAAGSFASPAYTLVDVRAGWDGVRLGRVRVSPHLGLANLFDVRYNASVVVNAFGRRYYEPGPGRAAYLGMEAHAAAR